MPTLTIGTTSRDFSTIAAWEAALSTGSQIGECYDDSAFDESATIDDTDPDDTTLTVAAGERHDGKAGTGARIVRSSKATESTLRFVVPNVTVEYLEVNEDGHGVGAQSFAVGWDRGAAFNATTTMRWMLIHGTRNPAGFRAAGVGHEQNDVNSGPHDLLNSIIYDIDGPRDAYGFYMISMSRATKVLNVTSHDISAASDSDPAHAYQLDDNSVHTFRNLLGTSVSNSGTGGDGVFNDTSFTSATASHNASDDATASGTGSLTNIVTANQYVSTVVGSEDLHIQDTDADIYEAGTDLGTTPTGVNIDIDGYDRDAGGTTWSIGAHDGNDLRGGGGTFTATAAATLGGIEGSASSSFAPGTKTATADVTLGGIGAAASASHDDPDYTATAAATLGGVEAAAAAAFTPEMYTGGAAITIGAVLPYVPLGAIFDAQGPGESFPNTFIVEGGFQNSAHFEVGAGDKVLAVGTSTADGLYTIATVNLFSTLTYFGVEETVDGASTGGNLRKISAGAHTAPSYTATATPTIGGIEAAASGTTADPVYDGVVAVSLGGVEAAISSTFDPGAFTSTASVSVGPVTATASAVFAVNVSSGSAAVAIGGVTMSASATFVAIALPSHTGCSARSFVYVPGASRSSVYRPGSETSSVYRPGSVRSTVECQ